MPGVFVACRRRQLSTLSGVLDGREGEDADAEPSLGWPAGASGAGIDCELDEAEALDC